MDTTPLPVLYVWSKLSALRWEDAVPAMFPDRVVLTQDSSYP